jgi:hypothetical protein
MKILVAEASALTGLVEVTRRRDKHLVATAPGGR